MGDLPAGENGSAHGLAKDLLIEFEDRPPLRLGAVWRLSRMGEGYVLRAHLWDRDDRTRTGKFKVVLNRPGSRKDAFARSLRQLAWHRVELLQYQFADQPPHRERGEDSRLRLNGMSLTAFIKMAEERLSL